MSSARLVQRGTGSQGALRHRNARRILDTLAHHGTASQAELSRLTGLSPATVSNIVRDLLEDSRVEVRPGTRSGRRASVVSLAPDPRLVVGIDIGRSHLTVMFSDIAQRTFGHQRIPLKLGHTPRETLALASQTITQTLEDSGVPRDRVLMAGIAVPASVSPDRGEVLQASSMPEWAGYSLTPLSSEMLDLPTVVANDADLGALAHLQAREDSPHILAYIKVATGIGMGVAIDAVPLRTTSGMVGEVGHIPTYESGGDICYCGNRGCLETVASVRSILAHLGRIWPNDEPTVEDVVAALTRRDPIAMRVVTDAGAALGKALALVRNILAPDVMVIGGPLAQFGPVALDAVTRAVELNALAPTVVGSRVELSHLADSSEVRGACAAALSLIDA